MAVYINALHPHQLLHPSIMAAPSSPLPPSLATVVVVVLFLIVAPAAVVLAAADGGGTTTHLHFFMHDILTPGSNATAVQVIKGTVASAAIPGVAFGDTIVIDDALTESFSPASAAVGRAQGFYMMTSLSGAVLTVCANFVLTSGDYNGSTIAVMGPDDIAADVRELSVVGGTGKFRMATGYVLWKTASTNGADATIELDVYVSTTGGGAATIDSSTPVSTIGGGGGSSSAAVRPVIGAWVNSYIVALLVAVVVGSSYV